TPALTRIENTPDSLAARCREQGYRVAPKEPDYVYRRTDLVTLLGYRYKSQRVAYNHCVAHAKPMYRPFRPDDADACLVMFQQWRQGMKHDSASDLAGHLAADAEHAHRQGIAHAADLGLLGRVVEVEGQVAAYTFGYPLNISTFCVLFEIADRDVKGLGAYIFREFCRELESYELINTMDDSGLEGLRRAKLSYHPIKLVESYIVSPA
ncbi:MAG TPA: phosphatidylglycerol lysyltransferase domain-containing protein, partial [Nitrospirales bacterium]|nr:phosphatidylglycerol lysyltransferase domain-containing protein [Nitrospirales bacterium]